MANRYRTRWGRMHRRGVLVRRGGYNLVLLMVIVALMNIAIAASLPTWTAVAQRDREQELIFRGLQYAEAIRIFQLPPPLGQGRLPVRVEELLEVEPRSIRQLWTNPMSEDARWKLIVQGVSPTNNNTDNQQPNPQPENLAGGQPGAAAVGGGEDEQVIGPFTGVMSSEGGESFLTFFESNDIGEWQFTSDLVTPRSGPGTVRELQNIAGGWPVNASTFWLPFPPELDVQRHGPGQQIGGGPGNALGRQRQQQGPSNSGGTNLGGGAGGEG
ncbi:MAG: type II secretion system protein [Acidobacteriota bacterium]